MGLASRGRVTLTAVLVGTLAVGTTLVAGQALADHADEDDTAVSDCTFTSEGGNTGVGAGGVVLYAGPNSSGPDPEGSNRVAAGVCADDNDAYEGTNEVAVDPDTLYYHVVSDGGAGNDEAFFDGWFGAWNCGGVERPFVTDGPSGNWHDDPHAPCVDQPERNECERGSDQGRDSASRPKCIEPLHRNDCPAEDLDPTDNRLSVQTPAGAACYDLAELSCAHIWADLNETNGEALSAYVSFGNDHPDNEEGCADPSDEPDDGRSANNGLCVGTENGPDDGAEAPVCVNPGDTLDEFGISLGSEFEECVTFVTGGEPNPDHSQPGVCADDDGDGLPDPGS